MNRAIYVEDGVHMLVDVLSDVVGEEGGKPMRFVHLRMVGFCGGAAVDPFGNHPPSPGTEWTASCRPEYENYIWTLEPVPNESN